MRTAGVRRSERCVWRPLEISPAGNEGSVQQLSQFVQIERDPVKVIGKSNVVSKHSVQQLLKYATKSRHSDYRLRTSIPTLLS
jgi:hypothetical protein